MSGCRWHSNEEVSSAKVIRELITDWGAIMSSFFCRNNRALTLTLSRKRAREPIQQISNLVLNI
ncbi:hypothetical protein PMI17_03208 [Pantoea sp. GM01]|nr:hypothetical protein PMI17_03208 [Pantoea sp. GM01]